MTVVLYKTILHQLDQNFHSGVAFSLADLHDSCVTTLAVLILGRDLIEEFRNQVNLLGVFLSSCSSGGNFLHRIQDFQHLTASMQSAGKILLNGLLFLVVYGYFLAVYNFFYSLAVLVLAGNFGLYGNLFEVVLPFYRQGDAQ